VTSVIHQEALSDGLTVLRRLLEHLTYREGWHFKLYDDYDRGQGSRGATLVITVTAPDSAHPEDMIRVAHYMPVPPAAYNERSWTHWLFDQIGLVERHERMEFFRLHGKAVYPPQHSPGYDPYQLFEYGSIADAETDFRGVRHEGTQAHLRDT
jgi:hypothetical protein